MSVFNGCENCSNYVYNEDCEFYECIIDLDEDEFERFITNTLESCPYYNSDDEYKIVRKQN